MFLWDICLVFFRGFIQVTPVCASTYLIAKDRAALAAVVGWWISFVWWLNAGTAAAHTGPGWAAAYASGAFVGTIVGSAGAKVIMRLCKRGPGQYSRVLSDRRDATGHHIGGP